MYIIGEDKLSDAEAKAFAEELGGDLDTIATANNWEFAQDEDTDPPKEGKLNGSTETIPPTEPEKKKKKDGESTLEVTSSELPESRLGEIGSNIIEARANVTAESVADQIGVAYFNLEERDGLLFPKTPVGSTAISGFSQGQGVSSNFLNETGLVDALGEEKAKQWQELTGGSAGVSKEDLKEKLDLSIIDSGTINSIIGSNQTKQAEIAVRDMSELERESLRDIMPSSEAVQDDIKFIKNESKALNVGIAYFDAEVKVFDKNKKEIESQSAELKKSVERRKEIVDSYTVVPGMDMPTGYQESYKLYESSLNNYNSFISSEAVTSLGNTAARLSAASDLYNQRSEKLNQLSSETAENLAVGSAINKNYSMVNTLGFGLEESILGTTSALLGLGADALDYLVANDKVSNSLANFKGRTTQYAVNLETRRLEEIPIPLTISDVESGAVSQADFAGDVFLNNAPTVLTVMGPAGVGKGIAMGATRKLAGVAAREAKKVILKRAAQLSGSMFFVMEAGGSLSTTDSAKREARKTDKVTGLTEVQTLSNALENKEYSGQLEKTAIEERINTLTSAINVSEIERASVAMLKGGTAMYAERLGTLRSLKNLGSWSKQLGKAQFAKYFNPSVARWASKTAGAARGASQLVGMELIEEGLTLASHNFLDISILDMNKSVTDGMDKDFLANVILPTLAIGGPGIMSNVGSAIRSEYLTKKQSTESANIISNIFSMQDKLETTNMSEYDRSILEQKKMDALNQLSLNDADALIAAGKLGSQDLETLADLQGKLSGLRSQAMALGADGVDSKELQNIKDEISEVVSKREAILESNEEAIAEKVKGAQNEAEALMRVKAYERNKYVSQRYYGDKYISIEETSEENKDPYSGVPNSFIEKYSSDLFSAEARGDFGFFKDGYAIIFEKNAIAGIMLGGDAALFASTAPIHEIAHGEIAAKGLISDVELSQLGNRVIADIKETLEAKVTTKEITSAQFETFLTRLNAYQNLATKRGTSIDAEEVMMIVGDMKAGGILSTNDFQALPLVKAFVNSTLNKVAPKLRLFVPLNNYADVSAFFNSFQNKVFEGGVKAQTRPPEEGDEKASLGTLLEDINALLPDEVTTRDQFFDRKVFNPIYNDGNLHPAIANYIRSRSVSKEESQKIIDSVADRLINFNPEAKRKSGDAKITLGEFIFSNVNFGKLDARKALFEESQETARTQSTDTAEAKEIAAVAEDAVQVESEVKYKNLIRRRVLAEESIVAAKAKVLSSVRVLKTRIDAVVGKNVTVTPLIAEIKKVLGKQLDIDFKKELGGKKDGQLRKYLLKNKAAILENMTTTWLMTAMPNAVQKQVGGVWTSNWQGKKIDRESVDTNKAGRTSGAELVRRLPKAATRLPDAEFLSNILAADGNPIRGRKESLAKAMAEQYAIEIIKEGIADPNSEIGKAFLSNQERQGVDITETVSTEFNKQAEQGNVKFSLGLGQVVEFLENPNFDMQLGNNREKGINKLFTIHGKEMIFTLDTKEDIDAWAEATTKYVLPILPKNIFFSESKKTGEFKDSGSSAFRRSNRFVGNKELDGYFQDKINEMRALPSSAFAPAIEGLGGPFSASYDVNIGTSDAAMQKNIDNGKVAAFNNYWGTIHRVMWENINDTVRNNMDNPDALRAIGNYMSNVSNDKSHPHKMGAEFVGYSLNAKGKTSAKGTFRLYEWEHAMPATSAYLYLLDAAINGFDFNAAYDAVMSNYKLIALDTAEDLNIKAAGLSNGMPKGWKLTENNWTERYSESNVDLANIMTVNGKNLKEALMSANAEKFDKRVDKKALKEAQVELDKPSKKMSAKASLGLSEEFNNIIERKTGVESYKTYSEVQAKMRGAKKGKFKFFIAPGADDFRGLVNYAFAGKGKQGEADMRFFEEKLLNPYFKGIAAIESARQAIRRDYTKVIKLFKPEHKMMKKKIGNSQFTYDQAVRVYLWEKQGTEIPGVSKRDLQLLRKAIADNPSLTEYADAMLVVSKRTEWIVPSDYWTSQTILSDLNSMTEKIGRKKYLEEFIETSEAIFTDENMNKIEALYGTDHRAALEDSLYAMKNGSNRPFGKNKQVNKWLNWINGSTGAIMFFNRRSALLQMLSFTNFTNWGDNNPLKQAAAFANQKQYWSDFAMIFNSDKLKERRSGLKTDVSESEIANAVANGKNSPNAALNYILKLGFTPTQIADSFAIATGGAMFYRNRVNSYLKEGMSKKQAEDKAFLDFSKRSDEAQQSSDPALVSMQQRSVLGRLVLAFANTPMQYTRLMKKAGQDLINGRGSFKENMSKIAYYGIVQNFIFSSLQSALFALAFDDEDEEELSDAAIAKKEEYETSRVTRVLNGMMDTVLRGSGVYGAVASVVKNTILEYRKQEAKGFLGQDAAWLLQILNLSPPIGSKVRKIYSAARTRRFEKDTIAERGWALTADGKLNLGPNYNVLGSLVSGIANVPLDRIVDELRSVTEALDERNKAWQRIALAFGWKTWDVGALNEEGDLIKAEAKVKRKEAGKAKAKATRAKNKGAGDASVIKDASDF